MIKVLLTDDQRLMRDGMRTLLSLEPDLTVVGEASNGREAVDAVQTLQPDVVLMDIRMPVMNGVEATREIGALRLSTKVLILTTFDDDELVLDALREGAAGYLTKEQPAEQIADAIRQVLRGGVVIPPPIAAKVVASLNRQAPSVAPGRDARLEELTERERDVLRLLGQGFSNKEIGESLFITEGTAKNHVSNIMEKLGLRDRTQTALWSVRQGLS